MPNKWENNTTKSAALQLYGQGRNSRALVPYTGGGAAKIYDVDFDTTPMQFNDQKCIVLNSMRQTFSDDGRRGANIINLSVTLRMHVSFDISATGTVPLAYSRILLVYYEPWKNFNPTSWSATEMTNVICPNNESIAAAAQAATRYSFANVNNLGSIKIIRDWKVKLETFNVPSIGVIDPWVQTDGMRNNHKWIETINLGKMVTEFSAANTGATGESGVDIHEGALLLITYSATKAAAPRATLRGTSRLRFMDASASGVPTANG